MKCPYRNYQSKDWCIDCKFTKDGRCDYPYAVVTGDRWNKEPEVI
jgi:hypothetical protein